MDWRECSTVHRTAPRAGRESASRSRPSAHIREPASVGFRLMAPTEGMNLDVEFLCVFRALHDEAEPCRRVLPH
jgi:hypothetical protein